MPFYANTPESLLGRSDSKNPSTTCRGITSSGRPCRRPIVASDAASPPSSILKSKSAKANLRVDDPSDPNLYCWQHKEQASLSAHSSPGPRVSNTPILEERTSLDTLADRLGIVQLQQEHNGKSRKHNGRRQSGGGSHGLGGHQQQPSKMTRPKTKQTVKFCFCFRMPVEEVAPPSRPKPRPLQPSIAPHTPTKPARSSLPPGSVVSGRKSSNSHLTPSPSPSRPHRASASSSPPSATGRRPSNVSTSSRTAQYLSLIPQTASPQTASLLMAELAKPISTQDEAGYIYIFWLTPESQPATPPAETARSLLSVPPSTPTRPGAGQRRVSDVLASFAALTDDGAGIRGMGSKSTSGSNGTKRILLKIGRATNVQRRLNEWQRQCGYNLSLIRYYPYIPSASPAAVPRKMPHSHKVERLIHIELGGLGLRVADREKCDACGREHREWFEVDATRKGVADVDEIVKRWVEWDEGLA